MAAESLREELIGLVGVAEVEVDEAADSPSGVRVRLEPDADARLVGAEVQRVLAAHGLRSRITAPNDPPGVAETVAGPAEAGILEATEAGILEETPESAPVPEPVPAPATPPPPIPAQAPFPAPPLIPPPPLTPPPVVPVAEPAPIAPVGASTVGSGLTAVSVEESRDGVSVTATAGDGRTITRRAEPTEAGMYEAAVAAVGMLVEGSPPGLISITPIDAGGAQAIAVVAERADGSKVAGAAIVKVGAAYAVGRATWAALQGS